MFIDMEQDAAIVSLFVNKGGRKFLVASHEGQGFVVNEDDCVGNTRKGKQVLNVEMPNEAWAIATVTGDTVAVIGTNHKMVIFPIDQVPEMARGRGVRLQKYTGRRAVGRRDLRFQGRPDLEGFGRPRPGHELEGIVGLARQPRRRRPPRAWPAEVEQVRTRRGVGRPSRCASATPGPHANAALSSIATPVGAHSLRRSHAVAASNDGMIPFDWPTASRRCLPKIWEAALRRQIASLGVALALLVTPAALQRPIHPRRAARIHQGIVAGRMAGLCRHLRRGALFAADADRPRQRQGPARRLALEVAGSWRSRRPIRRSVRAAPMNRRR